MCRWLAYAGSPVRLDKVLYSRGQSLIDQSLRSYLGAEPTNGDGFGVGWYDGTPRPGVSTSIEPAWNDRNLKELAEHIALAVDDSLYPEILGQTDTEHLFYLALTLGLDGRSHQAGHVQRRPNALAVLHERCPHAT
ncbi:MAG: hypothetical protein ACRDPA_24815 [Solirubrobacteraceae bacterium]